MSKQDTKQRLLDIGIELLIRDGFHPTGINELLDTASVPKGSFYYYFESKEDFGLQVLAHFASRNSAFLQGYLDDTTLSWLQRLRGYFEANIDQLASLRFTRGCLIGNLAQETADQSEVFRGALQQMMKDWAAQLSVALQEAQANGEIRSDRNADDLANFCLNSWQGALLRMKVVKNPEPLQLFYHLFFDVILR